ncbi:MAG: hypothetical protein U0174_04825 [Polyangiaceae bacterium]
MSISRASLLVVSLAVFACGGDPLPPPKAAEAPSAPKAAQRPGTVTRSGVRNAIADGPGAFLAHVELEDQPAFKDGRFYGFRIAKLLPASYWEGIDLKPGDVVAKINGLPIERPDHAVAIMKVLEKAKEIRVEVERSGALREVVIPIVED